MNIYLQKLIKFTLALLFLPLIIFIRLIYPIVKVRFGKIFSSRLGHLAFEIELYLCERDHSLHEKCFDIFYCNYSDVANYELLKMWKKCIFILHPTLMPLVWSNELVPGKKRHKIPLCTNDHKDSDGLLNLYHRHINFSDRQINELDLRLSHKIGFKINSKIITVHNRDSVYLNSVKKLDNTSYHNFRDSNIENYVGAIKNLDASGFSIFRIGVEVEKTLNLEKIKFYDTSQMARDELMDLYLIAKSKFFISTNSGPCAIATVFRTPNAFVNVAPFLGVNGISTKKDMFIHKKYWSKIWNRFLSIDEIFQFGLQDLTETSLYEKNNIILYENTEDEILEFTDEMNKKIDGVWIVGSEEKKLISEYKKILTKWNIEPQGMPKISYSFLKRNIFLVKR